MTDLKLSFDSSRDLTETDRKLCLQQCINQNATTLEDVRGMMEAFYISKMWVVGRELIPGIPHNFLDLILLLGHTVDRKANQNGFRSVPVVFANGDSGVSPSSIQPAMEQFREIFLDSLTTPDQIYFQFQKIHPFVDGNGRVGHCIWAMAKYLDSFVWPETLPPEMFS